VGRKRVARLMRIAGLCGASRRRWPRTTRQRGGTRRAPDLVRRHFSAKGPNILWVADATYIPSGEGFLYLAVVLDVFSRRIVGWAMSNHLYTDLMLRALNMALQQRRHEGVILHSDSKNTGTRCFRAVTVSKKGCFRERSGAVERSGRPDPHSDRLNVFPWTRRSSGTAERRGFTSSIRVTQEGPDALSLYCLVQVLDAGEIAHTPSATGARLYERRTGYCWPSQRRRRR
jgi:hypothetical protein